MVDFDVAEGVVNRLVTEDEEDEREGIAEVWETSLINAVVE